MTNSPSPGKLNRVQYLSPERGTGARAKPETFYVKLKLTCRIFRGRYHNVRRLGERKSSESLMMLRELNGHEVHTAYGGFEAIEAAAKLQPDVILMGHQPMFCGF